MSDPDFRLRFSEISKARPSGGTNEKFVRAEASILIMAPLDVVYRFFRDALKVPLRNELTEEIPGAMLAWSAVGEPEIEQRGRAWFAELPHDRGTFLRVRVDAEPSGGKLTEKMEAFFGGGPRRELGEELRRLRALMECGEAPTIEGQSQGGDQETDSLH